MSTLDYFTLIRCIYRCLYTARYSLCRVWLLTIKQQATSPPRASVKHPRGDASAGSTSGSFNLVEQISLTQAPRSLWILLEWPQGRQDTTSCGPPNPITCSLQPVCQLLLG